MFVLCELLVFSSVIGLSHLGEFCNSFVKYGAFVQRILGTFLTGMKIEQQRTAPVELVDLLVELVDLLMDLVDRVELVNLVDQMDTTWTLACTCT